MALSKYLSSKTKPELQEMIALLNLTSGEEEVFWYLSKGYNVIKISEEYGASQATITRLIKNIAIKIEKIEKRR